MDPKNYYKTLGVSHDASQSQINHAYRELAKKWHPDINHSPGAGKKFTKINQAYSVLGNKKKRQQYDQFGSSDATAGFGNSAAFNNYNNGGGFGDTGFGGFDDIFNDFFGGRRNSRSQTQQANAPQRGQDLQYNMEISFSDAVFGKRTILSYSRNATCPKCHGKGGSGAKTCPTCHGTGYTVTLANTPMGRTEIRRTCPTCHGKGKTVQHVCSKCHGKGRIMQKHELTVDIPAGISSGDRLRLQSQGEAGFNGGKYGDLFVVFTVKPSKKFTRHGSDVYTTHNISIAQAALGSNVTVSALDYKHKSINGAVALKVPAGTQSGTTFKLSGLGVRNSDRGIHGDEKVTIHVVIPKHLNHKQRQAMLAFAKASGDTSSGHNGMLDRVKNAFKNRK